MIKIFSNTLKRKINHAFLIKKMISFLFIREFKILMYFIQPHNCLTNTGLSDFRKNP